MARKDTFGDQDAKFVWTDGRGDGRNVFAVFRRDFRVDGVPKEAWLHLFADTRFRLRVNGMVVGYGPARFLTQAPEYDSHDLTPWLRRGRNVVTVEANSKGAISFEAALSRGGFIAWGGFEDGKTGAVVAFATPGDWRSCAGVAWDPWAPSFSFAQGPTEIVDLRELPADTFEPGKLDKARWSRATLHSEPHGWGRLRPRSIPLLRHRERAAERVALAGVLDGAETRIGFRTTGRTSLDDGRSCRVCYATHLYSPVDQTVTLGLFWGPHFLNGSEIEPVRHPVLGNREDYEVHLQQGWNFLYGEPETLADGWGVIVGFPSDRGLVASAECDLACADAMVHSEPVAPETLAQMRTKIPASRDEMPELPGRWARVPRGATLPVPARKVGWDRLATTVPIPVGQTQEIVLCEVEGGDAAAVFDFGGEFLGHPIVEIEAPAGTVVDVANAERLRADGLADLFSTHWGINSCDRFVWRGGRDTVEAFHPRGGRYVQVTIRGATDRVTVHRVGVRDTTYPLEVEGRFECSDPIFNWAWAAGVETLRHCMEDAYLDCPWRERGCYVGDALVEYHVTRAVTSDHRLARRCLWLWATGQRADGQMTDTVPTCHPHALPDYSLIWLIFLRDYWASTGDVAFVREVWPAVEKLFASPVWVEDANGLWDTDGLHVFLDAGAGIEAKRGASAAVNAFRYRALECAAELAAARKDARASERFAAEAKRLKRAMRTLWDPEIRRFAASRRNGRLVHQGAMHANALALLYGLVPREGVPSVLRFVGEAAETTLDPAHPYYELYFMYYVLGALFDQGQAGRAEAAMRARYGEMKQRGAWTIWEHMRGNSSLCHAWSCSALHFFSERVLGVRQARPGRLDRIVVAPVGESLHFAAGSVPHPLGPIHVNWQREGGRLNLDVSVPAGVHCETAPTSLLDPARSRVTIRQRRS